MKFVRSFLGATVLILAAAGLGSATARGQSPGEDGPTTSTAKRNSTTTTADPYYEPTTTTSTTQAPDDGPSGDGNTTTTSTTRPPVTFPPVGPGGGGGDGGGGGGGNGGGDDGQGGSGQGGDRRPPETSGGGQTDAGVSSGARVVPPGFQQIINSVKRSPANNTRSLLAAVAPLQDLGLSAEEAVSTGFGRFPIAGYASFVDDWWFPRFTPSFHLHQGTDIFATHGTPVRSPVDGVLRQASGAVGGLATYITRPDGSYFYMAHLAGFVAGQSTGQSVKVGEIVGYVGDTGNARGGAPHVHLQYHPRGGPPVNPKPYLDSFIADALADIPSLMAQRQSARPRVLFTTGLTRRLTEGRGAFASSEAPPRSQLLWASSASPGGALALADAELSATARGLDWDQLARADQDRRLAWDQADRRAQELLGPVTPTALARFLRLPPMPDRSRTPTVLSAPAASDTPGD